MTLNYYKNATKPTNDTLNNLVSNRLYIFIYNAEFYLHSNYFIRAAGSEKMI